MATLIICPACETRYETAAVFPPEGRKVRCSKCGNVWQAKPVVQPPAPAVPELKATPDNPFGLPAGSPFKVPADNPFAMPPPPPAPKATPKPKPAPVNSGLGGLGGFAGIAPKPEPEPSLGERLAVAQPETSSDVDFGMDEDVAAQVERMNAEAAMAAEGVLPGEKGPGIFARLRAKRTPAPVPAPVTPETPAFPGVPPAEAELAAMAAGASEHPPVKAPSRGLAMGWLALILFIGLIAAIFFFAKDTVLSILPGAAKLYGSPTASGLSFEGVRYGWSNAGGQSVLEIQGDVVNGTSSPVAVPQVVIALRDEKGAEISEWTTATGADELAAGERAGFLRQIPSPPSNVRSVMVRFAKAN
jgi:predicted Zn finger-like uncharacterized protein